MNQVVSNPKQKITFLRDVMQDCINRGIGEEIHAPVDHYHTDSLYGRRIYVPAKTTVITKVHVSQHITVALKGTCTVFGENGLKNTVTAPAVFVTEPGTCRAIYCHDDVEWLTVHHCELSDLDKIERFLTCDSFKEYDDRSDYKKVLIETGINEEIARLISENPEDQTNDNAGCENIYLSPSELEGTGVFANIVFVAGETIGIARINNLRTKIGRYTNHSATPNCMYELCDNLLKVIAIKDIQKDAEITVNYRQAFVAANNLRALT